MIFVGDPNQAIYGFAGADAKAYENILLRTSAKVLPLSVSYRCPKVIAELVKQHVAEFEVPEDAIEGTLRTIKEEQLSENVQAGDVILCRLNAPLVKTCIALIKEGVAARMRGRDIHKSLVKLAKDALGKGDWNDFPRLLDEHQDVATQKLRQQRHSEASVGALADRYEGVRAIYHGRLPASLEAFKAAVDALFAEDVKCVELSSIHRAKGLEWENVFALKPQKCPLIWKGQSAWEKGQEMNLKYVRDTRALKTLTMVEEK
jgi:superfamily I DNA/RNA helicase